MTPEKFLYQDELSVNYDQKYVGMNFPVFHCHNVYEIYLLESGERTIVIDDMMYKTYSNDVAMIRPYALHRSFGDTPYRGICINFSDAYLYHYFSETAKRHLLSCFSHPVIHLTSEKLNLIQELVDKILYSPTDQPHHFVYAAEILILLAAAAGDNDTNYHLLDVPKLNPVIDYIEQNFTQITGLDDISNALHMNKNYLCGLFKRKTGMTVSSYINTLRIQLACSFLTEGSYTVEEIGVKCGFASTSYFCRTFKKSLECTPSDFRKKALGKL